MIEVFGTIWKWLWRKKEWRPHLLNALLTISLAVLVFFYVNFKHDDAMAEIGKQATVGERILTKLDHVQDRIDELYKLFATP